MSTILNYVVGVPNGMLASAAAGLSVLKSRSTLSEPTAIDWSYNGPFTREEVAQVEELYASGSPLMQRMIPWMEWDHQKLTVEEVESYLQGFPDPLKQLLRPLLLQTPVAGYYDVVTRLSEGKLVPASYRYLFDDYQGWDMEEGRGILVYMGGALGGRVRTGRWYPDSGPGASDAMIFDLDVSFLGTRFVRHYTNTYDMPVALLPTIIDSIIRDLVLREPELIFASDRQGPAPRTICASLDKWRTLEQLP